MPLTSEVLYTSYNNFEKGQDSYFFYQTGMSYTWDK